ncbi:hypothetical protein GPROT2_01174 [Gammaproteobacteria bacterium]|nr:hypothetical protein GPROT2_01174 [Gammaproteobacteria bacterium]
MKNLVLATAMLALSASVDAAIIQVTPVSHLTGRASGAPTVWKINPAPTFSGDVAGIAMPTFWFNDVTGELSSSGVAQFRVQTSPTWNGLHFDRFITDLNIVGGSAAGSTAYNCTNGGFGNMIRASMCGNYLFGGDDIDNSTVTYGPGTAFSRVIGGDDVIAGAQQSIDDYNLALASFNGSALVFESADWTSSGGKAGLQLNFAAAAVPLPAAGWLFGPLIGLLALVRRRLTGS